MSNKKTIAWHAKQYARRYQWHLVPIEPGRKFPRTNDWGKKTITDPDVAEAYYTSKADWNMGVALGPSRMCSLDIDCMQSFKIICDAFNVDIDLLTKDHPTIQGQAPGMRVMFRVPEGVNLPYVKLNWRPEIDPTGEKHKDFMRQAREAKASGDVDLEAEIREKAKPYALYTVFELRSACDGSQKQDVLPPSMHPDTGEPYTWITPPKNDIPEPPLWLLTIWQEFDKFRKQFLSACPWVVIEEIYQEQASTSKPRAYSADGGLVAVSNEYSKSESIETSLMHYGYTRVGKNRYLSPSSQTGLPGVVIMPGNKAWVHHASDPLCSDENGQPVSPFDLYCEYEHGGDFAKAAKALAPKLNMRTDTPSRGMPPEPEFLPYVGEQSATPPSELTVNLAEPLPWVNSKGKPYKNIDNLREIVRRIGATVRYNVMRKEEEIIIPGKAFSMDNAANASFAFLTSICSMFEYATDKNQEFITYLADENQYSPVVEWLGSSPWDGKPRLQSLLDTVITSVDRTQLKDALIKRWMLSAIHGVFSGEGVAAQGVLVFQGAQNLGKTEWFKSLVPESVNRSSRMRQDGLMLRPDDKDSVKQVNSHWLVELGELDATFKKSDQAMLKAFLGRDVDTIRRPYARKESDYARRTVFFASVNPREYLQDDTGNRRYWTVECQSINSRHNIDMQQVWAEVFQLWCEGERHHLTADEFAMLNSSNEDFEARDPIEERIISSFYWQAQPELWLWKSATDALISIGIDRPTRADIIKAGRVLREMNGNVDKRTSNARLLLIPPRQQDY